MSGAVKPRFRSVYVAKRRNRLKAIEQIASELLGFDLSPWQANVLKTATQFDPKTDKPFYRNATITVPRQSGKTFLMFALMTELAMRQPGSRIAFTAQTRLNAARRILDLGALLIRRGVGVKVTRGIGNEKVEFPNGSLIEVMSPVESGFHGDSVDLGVLDETWKVEEVVMQGLIPATAARPNAQTFAISTMGTPDSTLLNRLVDQGREAVEDEREDRIYYCEYSAAEDDDPFDPATWKRFHPALGLTVDEDSIAAAMEVLLPGDFVRAYANQMVDTVDAAIPWDVWERCYRSNVAIPERGLTLAVDLGMGPDSASLAVAWETEKGIHSELVEQRFGNLEWLAGSVEAYLDRRPITAVVIDAIGPARAVETQLRSITERRGVDLFVPKSGEVVSACATFFDLVRRGEATHGPAEPLDQAVKGVVLRTVADSWVWSRRQSRNDVSPLYATTLAVWSVHEQIVAPRPVLSIH